MAQHQTDINNVPAQGNVPANLWVLTNMSPSEGMGFRAFAAEWNQIVLQHILVQLMED